jgi:hypothetical protein
MLKATGKNPKDFCTACFTDQYPIQIKFNGQVGPNYCGHE